MITSARIGTRHVRLGVLLLLGIAGWAVTFASNGASVDRSDTEPRLREVFRFDSLPVMTATADSVVLATVTGRQAGPQIGESSARFVDLHLSIDEHLVGQASDAVIVRADPISYGAVAAGDIPWMTVGSQSILFLRADPLGGTHYWPLNTQSIYLADGEQLRVPRHDHFAEAQAAMGRSGFIAAVTRAQADVAAGAVKPLTAPAPAP